MASINLPEGFVIDNEPVEADREEMFGLPEGFVVDGVEAPEAPEAPEPVAAPTEPEPVEDAIGIGTYASEAGKAVVRGAMDVTASMSKGLAADGVAPPEKLAEIDADMRKVPEMSDEQFNEFMMRIRKWVPGKTLASGRAAIQSVAQMMRRGMISDPTESPLYKGWSDNIETDLKSQTLYKVANDIAEKAEEIAPQDPRFRDSWTTAIAGGIGSTVPFLAAGAVPGGLGVGLAAGVAAQDGEAIERAEAHGATLAQTLDARRGAGVVGLTEQLPIEVLFERVPVPVFKMLKEPIRKILVQAVVEGGQEGLQTTWQNYIEGKVYNPDKGLLEDVPESMALVDWQA